MSIDATIGTLFDTLQGKLDLQWDENRRGQSRIVKNPTSSDNDMSLVGYLNLIHPHRVQILGKKEVEYLNALNKSARDDLINRLFSDETDLVVFAHSAPVPDDIRQRATAATIPVFTTITQSQHLLDYLRYYLTNVYAEKITVHGVFMEVFSLGVLITGTASVGKSELALELITRGHRLVADDAPEFSKTGPELLTGHCPEVLQDCLEVRGLGILDIRAMFGDSAIKRARNLRLIINLETMIEQEIHQMDRLTGSQGSRSLLGIDIPEVTLPVTPGRNLAILTEAASRSHTLRLKGFDANKRFIERHTEFMQTNSV